MRKFKCYNCGAICAVDDSVTQAQCPTCGTVCVLAPKAPAPVAPAAYSPAPVAPAPAAVAPVAPAPAAAPAAPAHAAAPAAPAPAPAAQQPRPVARGGDHGSSEWAEKGAIFTCLKRYVAAKNYAELYSLIMNAPIQLARQALTAKVKCQFATFMFAASGLGFLGVDRFYMGSIVAGVFKLLTGGGFGIWYVVDIFVSWQQCRTKNLKKIKAILQPAVVGPAPVKA